uniref:WxxW domain-containing protein n=3 Tax=Ciona intestinalis TaxID=7719 RepID=F6Q6M5_CIOIN
MCDNLQDQRSIQPNPFLQPSVGSNARVPCSRFPALNMAAWRDSSPNPLDTTTSPEFTAWFVVPFKNGNQLSTTALLDDLLVRRPDDVCSKVLGTEERTVRGNKQIRFKCPPGSIRATDFPKIESPDLIWTAWEDNSTPRRPRFDDNESRDESHVCLEPLAIQAQTLAGRPARETGDVFRKFSPLEGLDCLGSDQTTRRCNDYRVRYLCRTALLSNPTSGPSTTTQATTTATTTASTTTRSTTLSPAGRWTAWISLDVPQFGSGDNEYLFRVANAIGFCRNPTGIRARTVGTHISSRLSGDVIYSLNARVGLICRNYQQTSGRCQNYEVSYFCQFSNING